MIRFRFEVALADAIGEIGKHYGLLAMGYLRQDLRPPALFIRAQSALRGRAIFADDCIEDVEQYRPGLGPGSEQQMHYALCRVIIDLLERQNFEHAAYWHSELWC